MIEPIYNDYDRLLKIPSDLGGGIIDTSYSDLSVTSEPVKTVLDPVYKTQPVSYDPTIRIEPIDMSGFGDLFTEDLITDPVLTREPVKTVLDPVYKPEPVYQEPTKVTAPVQTTAPIVSAKIAKTVRILDDQGTPVPGVHVFFDQQSGTVTNFNGEATISGDGTRKVYITHVGFEPRSYALKDLPASLNLTPGESLAEVIIDAPAKVAETVKKHSKYLIPAAIGGAALLIFLLTRKNKTPKKVTL